MIQDRAVTISEASVIFGVPRWRLYRMAREQRIWPVAAHQSTGCKGQVAYYRLSHIARELADDHERHAVDDTSDGSTASAPDRVQQ